MGYAQKTQNSRIRYSRGGLLSTRLSIYLPLYLIDSLLLLAASFCTCTLTYLSLAFRLSTQHSTLGLPEVDT